MINKTRLLRINRFLAEAGIAARRKADLLVAQKRVTINGIPALIGQMVDPQTDCVMVDGKPVSLPSRKRWYLLNKPAGLLSAAHDPRGRRTVLDLFPSPAGLFPVGRLDREVTGVLLITDDGETAYRLTHPRFEVEKVYRMVVTAPFSRAEARQLVAGVIIAGNLCRARSVRIISQDTKTVTVEMTLTEGRKHEVKELIKAVGSRVLSLQRISFAGLTAQGLKPGEWRELTKEEIAALKEMTARKA